MLRIGKRELISLYEKLLRHYGEQNWWPIDEEYHKNHETDPREEIIIGAILTQNTNWKNVEKALNNLKKEKLLSFRGIRAVPKSKLESLIKPAGFYRQKATYLKNFVNLYKSAKELEGVSRKELLKVKGIGKETADAIVLYAFNRYSFVIDAYTRRLLERLWNIRGNYDELKKFFEDNLPKDLKVYKEFHALIDEHCKQVCRKNPLCEICILDNLCSFKRDS